MTGGCATESTWAAYLDRALEPDQVRALESHLVTCQKCRARVVGLEEEAALLARVLHDPEPLAATAPIPAGEDPGLTWAMPLTIAAVAGALAIVGALAESRLPSGFDFLNPLRLMGAYEMAFDLFFLLRDEAPEWFGFAVSLGATGSVAALATLAVGLLSRRLTAPGAGMLGILALALAPLDVAAVDLRFDQDTHVKLGESISESLVASGDRVDVDGVIHGNLLVAAEQLTVRGTVDGDLYALAREVEIQGVVMGSVHLVSERIRIGGEVRGGLISGVERFILESGGRLARDAAFFGEQVTLEGRAGRDVVFLGDTLEVRGEVVRDVDALRAKRVLLHPSARVGGDLDVALSWNTEVEVAPGARVDGEIHERKLEHLHESYLGRYLKLGFYVWMVIEIAGAILFGLLLHAVAPQLFEVRVATPRRFFQALGAGALFVLATPLALGVAAVTVVGIPVAVLGLFLFLTILYLAHILVAYLVGQRILRGQEPGWPPFLRRLLLGTGVIVVAAHLPFLGLPVHIVVLLLGLGLLIQRGRTLRIVARSPHPQSAR